MKITSVQTIRLAASARGFWVFVRVATDEGLSGLGEMSQSFDNDLVEHFVAARLAPALLDRDPLAQDPLRLILGPQYGRAMGLPLATAVGGLEQALWDLRAQAIGLPLYQLLGGRHRDRVRLYANVNRAPGERTPAAFAAIARRAVAAGFTAIKCSPFEELTRRRPDAPGLWQAVDQGLARLHAVREAIGPDVDLLVDCHDAFTPPLAIQAARLLEPLRLFWLEEPVRWEVDPEGARHVSDAVAIPLAGGELSYGVKTFGEMTRARVIDVLMPDVKHCGGVREAQRIAALAEAAGLTIAPHSPSGPVSTLASAHLALAIPNFLILEYPFGEVDWRGDLVAGAEQIVGGHLIVPETPGLGLRLDPDVVAAHLA